MRIKDNSVLQDDIYNIYDVCEEIVDIKIFKKQFDIFTDYQLHLIDWNNVVVVGESILISLKTHFFEHIFSDGDELTFDGLNLNNKELRLKFREQYKAPIHLCIYGLDGKELVEKRKELIDKITDFIPLNYAIINDDNKEFVVIIPEYPLRPILIDLIQYESMKDVLNKIDIDVLSICYDNKEIYTSSNMLISLQTKKCIVKRRYDYIKMNDDMYDGYTFELDNLNKELINPYIYIKNKDRLTFEEYVYMAHNNNNLLTKYNEMTMRKNKQIPIYVHSNAICLNEDVDVFSIDSRYECDTYEYPAINCEHMYIDDIALSYIHNDELDLMNNIKNINSVDMFGRNFAHISIIFKKESFWHLPDQLFIDKTEHGLTSLHLAIQYNCIEYIDKLIRLVQIDEMDEEYISHIAYCIIYDRFDILKKICKEEPKEDGLLSLCLTYNRHDIAKYLLEHGYTEDGFLNKIVDKPDIVMFRLLMKYEPNLNRILNNKSPLNIAIDKLSNKIYLEIVQTLLSHNAFVEYDMLNTTQPLIQAVTYGYVNLTRILIVDKGANINCLSDKYQTPLDIAEEKSIELRVDISVVQKHIDGLIKENMHKTNKSKSFKDIEISTDIDISNNEVLIEELKKRYKIYTINLKKYQDIHKELISHGGKRMIDIDTNNYDDTIKYKLQAIQSTGLTVSHYKPSYKAKLDPPVYYYLDDTIVEDQEKAHIHFQDILNGGKPTTLIYSNITKITPYHLAVMKNVKEIFDGDISQELLTHETKYGTLLDIAIKYKRIDVIETILEHTESVDIETLRNTLLDEDFDTAFKLIDYVSLQQNEKILLERIEALENAVFGP